MEWRMQYIDALGNWFVGIVALFIAICGQYLRRINLYPDLQLEVPERYLHKTFLGEQPNQVDAFYVSFIVRNNGNEAAEDVEVFVERTEITRQDGLFDDIGVQQPMNLRVAYGANYAITRTIHKKHFAYFNLGHIQGAPSSEGNIQIGHCNRGSEFRASTTNASASISGHMVRY
jgi:hypothetical protein